MTADPPASASDAWARPVLDRNLALLGEIAEIGLQVARAVERQVTAEGPVDVEGAARAYARAARAVRQTVMLQSRIIEAIQAGAEAIFRARQAAEDEAARAAPGYVRKARIERVVERLAMAEHGEDEDEVDRLVCEAGERLDDEDLYGDLMDRPMSELVERICKDLGLDADWTALARELWARREVESGRIGSPLRGVLGTLDPLPLDDGEINRQGDGLAGGRAGPH